MLVFRFMLSIFLHACIAKCESVSLLQAAVNIAVTSSFNNTEANNLNVVIENDLDENKVIFLDTIDNILMKKWTFKLQIFVNSKGIQVTSEHNLWFIDSYEAFRRLLPWTRNYHRDSQLFYFIVFKYSETSEKRYMNEIEKIFSDFLKLMIANVYVITESGTGEVLFYTFYPYQDVACRSAQPFITHRFNNISTKPIGQFFPPKADNFHGCPLRITSGNELILNMGNYAIPKALINYELSILEVVMIKEFARRMNFILKINKWSNSTSFSLNGTGLLSNEQHPLINGEIDVILSFSPNGPHQNYFLSKSVTYCLSWMVIALNPRPNTLLAGFWLLAPFNLTTWTFTVVSFAIKIACILYARRIKRLCRTSNLQFYNPGALDILSLAIGVPVLKLPGKNGYRFSFICLSFGTLVLRAAYQGKLFDAYRRQTMLKLPHNITELLTANYTIYTEQYYVSIIYKLSEARFINTEILNYNFRKPNLFKTDKRMAMVNSYIYIYTFHTSEQIKKLMLKIIFGEQICVFFQQHSVIQPKINDIIMRMEEAGILHYFRKNFENIKSAEYVLDKSKHEPEVLVLERLAFTFYLWGALCAISCLVFIMELLCNKIKKRNL